MHTNETSYLHLSQFVGTDIPNPLTDYNEDMAKIDTAVSAIAGAEGGFATDIAALQSQNGSEVLTTVAQTISGAVNELDADTADLQSRVTIVEGKIVADESTLATTVTNVSTLAGKVSALEVQAGNEVLQTTSATLSGAVNELKAEIDGTAGGAAGLSERLTSAEADISDIKTQNGNATLITTAQTLSGAINELAQGGGSTPSASAVSYDNITSGLSATNVQAAIDEVVGDIPSTASAVPYVNTTSGLSAANVQSAIDELATSGSNASGLGTRVNITSYSTYGNAYTTPNDGYVTIYRDNEGTPTAKIYGSNSTSSSDAAISARAFNNYETLTVYVRKGMKVVAESVGTGNGINFTPFV